MGTCINGSILFSKAGKREEFHNILKIIKADLNKYPEIMADNYFYQKRLKPFKNEPIYLNELK